ncbi:MAG: hypothetical protein HKN34_01355 [Gammaproteobacteria bacterium]|nr:hypothetical protein [Gammaproteobacteria bacterium]
MPAKTNRAQRRLIMAVMALYFIYPAVEADNEEPALYVGDWTGFYRAGTVEWEEAKFFVKETGSKSDEKSDLSLTIQLNYLPKEEWRFEAKDLEVDTDGVKFQFGKNSFQLKCDLEKTEDLELVGNCKPIDESAGSTASEIKMVPPRSKEKEETQQEKQGD